MLLNAICSKAHYHLSLENANSNSKSTKNLLAFFVFCFINKMEISLILFLTFVVYLRHMNNFKDPIYYCFGIF